MFHDSENSSSLCFYVLCISDRIHSLNYGFVSWCFICVRLSCFSLCSFPWYAVEYWFSTMETVVLIALLLILWLKKKNFYDYNRCYVCIDAFHTIRNYFDLCDHLHVLPNNEYHWMAINVEVFRYFSLSWIFEWHRRQIIASNGINNYSLFTETHWFSMWFLLHCQYDLWMDFLMLPKILLGI